MDFFKSLGNYLPELLYPGRGLTYRQALTYVTRMGNKTRIKRLAELGFNFSTNEFGGN